MNIAVLWNNIWSRIWKQTPNQPRMNTYKYRFQQHPFDNWHIFEIEAMSQKEANIQAQEEFTKLFEAKKTVMTVFYPV